MKLTNKSISSIAAIQGMANKLVKTNERISNESVRIDEMETHLSLIKSELESRKQKNDTIIGEISKLSSK